MANRYMNQFVYSFEQKPCVLFAKVTIAGTGAPTLVAANSKGIASITRNGAGDYSVVLQDNYNSLLSMNAVFNAGSSAPASPDVSIKADTVNAATSPTLRILCTAAGVATDPASGEIMYLEIILRNSSR